jgi:hypothetical protein
LALVRKGFRAKLLLCQVGQIDEVIPAFSITVRQIG